MSTNNICFHGAIKISRIFLEKKHTHTHAHTPALSGAMTASVPQTLSTIFIVSF